jgi:hypothetical protein
VVAIPAPAVYEGKNYGLVAACGPGGPWSNRGDEPMIRSNRPARWLGAALLSLSFMAVAAPGFAQQAQQQEISPDQLALARQYVDLTDITDLFGTTVAETAAQTLQQVLKLNPQIGNQANDVVMDVVKQYKGHNSDLMDQIARLYAERFTSDELKKYVDFYSSPEGKKLAKTNFEINQQAQQVLQLYTINLKTEFYAKVRAELKSKGVM